MTTRTRRDRCPGVLRPWPADDGPLVRVRVPGGELSAAALAGLSEVAARFGDGDLHLTARANLQLRGTRHDDDFVRAIEALGLLPSRAHDQARNVLVSPLTGRDGGRVDLRSVVRHLDAALLASPSYAVLPGRFQFVLDDGRGDLLDRDTDLGLVGLDDRTVQLRVGPGWGPVVAVADAVSALLTLVDAFLTARGDDVDAAWHVAELAAPLATEHPRDPRTDVHADPPTGPAVHPVAGGVLGRDLVAEVTAAGHPIVLTPWHSLIRTELL